MNLPHKAILFRVLLIHARPKIDAEELGYFRVVILNKSKEKNVKSKRRVSRSMH